MSVNTHIVQEVQGTKQGDGKELLKVLQICYNEQTKKACFYEPYFNTECTQFFENGVIRGLVNDGKHKEAEYFGVLSWRFKERRPRVNLLALPEFLEKEKPDFVSFWKNWKQPKVFRHGSDAKKTILKLCFEKLGIAFDFDKNTTFYCLRNYFIAKSEVYERYCKELLFPAMDLMENDSEVKTLVEKNYQYDMAFRRFGQNPDLKRQLGCNYYQHHAFCLELLPSVFVTMNKGLKAVQYE